MMRKGQLSLMIIIGLLVLIVAAIGYYLVGMAQERASPSSASVTAARDVVTPVQEYISGCLRVSATEAMDLLGKQGGVIYRSQGGVTPDDDQIEGETVLTYDNKPVLYALEAPFGQVGDLYFAETPAYPWPRFPLWADPSESIRYEGYFGVDRLPALNGSARSMQVTLVSSVQERMDRCLDWTKLGLPQKVTSEPSVVSVLFNEEDTLFTLNSSTRIVSGDGSVDAVVPSAVAKLPVRLRKVYDAAKMVVGEEGKNSTFVPVYASDGIVLSVMKDPPRMDGVKGDDLFTFIDNKGRLGGAPFEFRVMRENRPPALEYIYDYTDVDKKEQIKAAFNLCPGSNVKKVGKTLVADSTMCQFGSALSQTYPYGVEFLDPDEDTMTFEILFKGEPMVDDTDYEVPDISGVYSIDVEVKVCETDNPAFCDWQTVTLPRTLQELVP